MHFITGRNEVLAKVIFLHLSVILFTGGGSSKFGGGLFLGGGMFLQIFLGGVSFWGGSSKFSGGEGGSPPEYGQRSAGTHPTGMHSCMLVFLTNHCTI